MKLPILTAILALVFSGLTFAQEGEVKRVKNPNNVSLKLEIERHIERGIAWLLEQQTETGAWGDETYPALTALPVAVIMGDPTREADVTPEAALRGYKFILTKQHRDGGIYGKGLHTYNTSLGMMALIHFVGQEEAEVAIRQARKFLINQQADYDVRGETDSPYDGGIGYGGSYPHSDLSNTHLAMEALYWSKKALGDRPTGEVGVQLNWDAAIEFVSRCQNLDTNDQPFVEVTPENEGGFVYFPGDSKAGEEEVDGKPEKVALRSYGSMGYAGLLSFVYAEMGPDDKRVAAVLKWLSRNYSIDENPGMEAQGLFYYYHTMAKALALTGKTELVLADGKKIDWREDLALKLFDLQDENGSWINEASSRWWEDDRVLVTSYAVLALQQIHRKL
ncbi:MAG: squalene-hopene/tetraprenyl-beta-curcumene cyclase [Verrucomicrobiales bacterium]|jgi:squalene-hopene/tetraprenyl-beta-curcumene cyclase